jgi:hypothetical protein
MQNPNQKGYMKNYYTMVIFFFMMLFAFKLSGYISGSLLLAGMLLASPSIVIKQEKYRWLALLAMFLLSVLFYPDLTGLKPAAIETLS